MTPLRRWVLIACTAAVVLPIGSAIAIQRWRDHSLLTFCKEVQVGMSFSDLLRLESKHWIGDSTWFSPASRVMLTRRTRKSSS